MLRPSLAWSNPSPSFYMQLQVLVLWPSLGNLKNSYHTSPKHGSGEL